MTINKPIEQKVVSEEVQGGRRTEPAKLVEMGEVSVETKGTARGLELGFTPRY
jgi:hypothetical protein